MVSFLTAPQCVRPQILPKTSIHGLKSDAPVFGGHIALSFDTISISIYTLCPAMFRVSLPLLIIIIIIIIVFIFRG